jgi:hypothetical protein
MVYSDCPAVASHRSVANFNYENNGHFWSARNCRLLTSIGLFTGLRIDVFVTFVHYIALYYRVVCGLPSPIYTNNGYWTYQILQCLNRTMYYKVMWWCVRVTIVAVEKQYYIL